MLQVRLTDGETALVARCKSCHYEVRCLGCSRTSASRGAAPLLAETASWDVLGPCRVRLSLGRLVPGRGCVRGRSEGLRSASPCIARGMCPEGQQAQRRAMTRRAGARAGCSLRRLAHPCDADRRDRFCRGGRHSKPGTCANVADRGQDQPAHPICGCATICCATIRKSIRRRSSWLATHCGGHRMA